MIAQRTVTEQLDAANRTCAQLQQRIDRLEQERAVLLRALDVAMGEQTRRDHARPHAA
jgi:hypothetical protein